MHCSRALGVFIVCYLAFSLSQVYALQLSTWSVHFVIFSLHFRVICMHCSRAHRVFIVCYLAFILSQVFALQPSTWSVYCVLLSLHFESFECITAVLLRCSWYFI